jgi:hypothetical protein
MLTPGKCHDMLHTCRLQAVSYKMSNLQIPQKCFHYMIVKHVQAHSICAMSCTATQIARAADRFLLTGSFVAWLALQRACALLAPRPCGHKTRRRQSANS